MLIISCCDPIEKPATNIQITADPVSTREDALQAYEIFYLGTEVKDPHWNGSLEECNPGTLPQYIHDKVLGRINFYRAMCGLPADIIFNEELNRKCQYAALMIHANERLSHNPPTSWRCWNVDGHEACMNSNISYGSPNYLPHTSQSIDYYMQDHQSDNAAMGHRRWLLYSRAKVMGHGSTTQANAIWVGGNINNPVPENTPTFIAYPPPGYIPSPVYYDYWTLSSENGDFRNATITMTDEEGIEIEENITYTSGVGDPIIGDYTIAWHPDLELNEQEDNTFNVKVENIKIYNTTYSFEYQVTIIPIEQ
ncbi:MAG: hypothetical protein CSA95_05100 [Bacteroidetes bacterium]|nr:MAG: hypothetical protein CSA95_05100 [Bacteroidota bacterium]